MHTRSGSILASIFLSLIFNNYDTSMRQEMRQFHKSAGYPIFNIANLFSLSGCSLARPAEGVDADENSHVTQVRDRELFGAEVLLLVLTPVLDDAPADMHSKVSGTALARYGISLAISEAELFFLFVEKKIMQRIE
jgi:hypothetical protein